MKKLEFAIKELESKFIQYKESVRESPAYIISDDEQLGLITGYQDAISDLKKILQLTNLK